jgi:hypothetical protein
MSDYRCGECGDSFCDGCESLTDPDWIAADREYGRRIHRTNRLMLAIELTEKLIDSLPEGSEAAWMMWEKNKNLITALLNHRKMGFQKNNRGEAIRPPQILKGK